MESAQTTFRDLIAKSITNLKNRQANKINTDDIAHAVYGELDPKSAAPTEVQYLAVLQLKGIARGELRKRFDPETRAKNAVDNGQMSLLTSELQAYYPDPNIQDEYVALELLDDEQCDILADRMEKCGKTLITHADNMRRYKRSRHHW